MYEVEVKAHLRDRQAVVQKLKDLGCKFSEELHQIDRIFAPAGTSFPPPPFVPVLRVRNSNGQSFFTLKIPQASRQDCIEREMKIEDGDMMVEIFQLMKYVNFPTVDKKRIKTKVGDIEVVLDEVEELGVFIEAEKIVKTDNVEGRDKTRDELFVFLETLGVSKEDRVIDGKYDIMLFEKRQGK